MAHKRLADLTFEQHHAHQWLWLAKDKEGKTKGYIEKEAKAYYKVFPGDFIIVPAPNAGTTLIFDSFNEAKFAVRALYTISTNK